jgi:hypothetical protein
MRLRSRLCDRSAWSVDPRALPFALAEVLSSRPACRLQARHPGLLVPVPTAYRGWVARWNSRKECRHSSAIASTIRPAYEAMCSRLTPGTVGRNTALPGSILVRTRRCAVTQGCARRRGSLCASPWHERAMMPRPPGMRPTPRLAGFLPGRQMARSGRALTA